MQSFAVIVTALSICSYFAVLVPPNRFYWAGFVGLCIPISALINVAAALYFGLTKRYILALITATVFTLFLTSSNLYSISSHDHPAETTFGVLSYNANKLRDSLSDVDYRHDFRNWLEKSDFDIVCLQEMREIKLDTFKVPGYNYTFSGKVIDSTERFGLLILSRHEIVQNGAMDFSANSFNRLLWADLAIADDTIRIINVHLKSYNLRKESLRRQLAKVRSALMARSWHTKLILDFIKQSPYPILFCGDLNEAPYSFPYREFSQRLNDTFVGSGAGYEYTYKFFGMPVRIDYIFGGPQLKFSDHRVIHQLDFSDHLPVSVRVGLPIQNGQKAALQAHPALYLPSSH